MKPSLGISFKIILEISLFQYVVISQCILICCKFIPPRHLTQIFLLVPFFWGWGGGGGWGEGRQAVSNEERNPKGLCNNTIYRWCASVHHNFFFLFLLSVYLSWLCSPPSLGVCGRGIISYRRIRQLGHCMRLEITKNCIQIFNAHVRHKHTKGNL